MSLETDASSTDQSNSMIFREGGWIKWPVKSTGQALCRLFAWRYYKFVYLFWLFAALDAAFAITDISITISTPETIRPYIYVGQYQYFLSIYTALAILCFVGVIVRLVKTRELFIRCVLTLHVLLCILGLDGFLQRISDIIFAYGLV